MAREISNYEQEAIDFLKAHKAKMTISHVSDEYGEWEISPMTRGWLYRVMTIKTEIAPANTLYSLALPSTSREHWATSSENMVTPLTMKQATIR